MAKLYTRQISTRLIVPTSQRWPQNSQSIMGIVLQAFLPHVSSAVVTVWSTLWACIPGHCIWIAHPTIKLIILIAQKGCAACTLVLQAWSSYIAHIALGCISYDYLDHAFSDQYYMNSTTFHVKYNYNNIIIGRVGPCTYIILHVSLNINRLWKRHRPTLCRGYNLWHFHCWHEDLEVGITCYFMSSL